jgi:hypothetical protein
MADRLFMADSAFPGFSGEETQEEKIQRILDYLYQMNEQYRYILCQLNIQVDETGQEDG